MDTGQLEQLNRLGKLQKELTNGSISYWKQYSSFNDWHFWLLVALSIIPLIVLFFSIDRRRLFHLGFFGFSVHIWHSYVDVMAVNFGKWTYPYKLIPFFPISFAFDASFIPVVFILVYQWTLNHRRNFYLYALMPAIFFAFIAKPLLVLVNITKPGPNGGGLIGYIVLFVSHLTISYVSKWLTDLFQSLLVKENSTYTQSNLERVPTMSWSLFRKKRKI